MFKIIKTKLTELRPVVFSGFSYSFSWLEKGPLHLIVCKLENVVQVPHIESNDT